MGGEIIVKKLIIAKQIKTRQLRQFLSNESKTHIVQIEKDPFFFFFCWASTTSPLLIQFSLGATGY